MPSKNPYEKTEYKASMVGGKPGLRSLDMPPLKGIVVSLERVRIPYSKPFVKSYTIYSGKFHITYTSLLDEAMIMTWEDFHKSPLHYYLKFTFRSHNPQELPSPEVVDIRKRIASL